MASEPARAMSSPEDEMTLARRLLLKRKEARAAALRGETVRSPHTAICEWKLLSTVSGVTLDLDPKDSIAQNDTATYGKATNHLLDFANSVEGVLDAGYGALQIVQPTPAKPTLFKQIKFVRREIDDPDNRPRYWLRAPRGKKKRPRNASPEPRRRDHLDGPTPKRRKVKPKAKVKKAEAEATEKPPRRRWKSALNYFPRLWTTLRHSGMLFPPDYIPHGVKMLYDGVPVDLTAVQEEVATLFAGMLESDYVKKERFLANFWEDWQALLGPDHTIQELARCDFSPIHDHLMAEREKLNSASKEEKKRIKEEKDRVEAKYKVALVDGQEEPVGKYRMEPTRLFRGRGEHPKMGKIKWRITPKDIIINIGEGEPVPEHPFPDEDWKEVRHDYRVKWLAHYKDGLIHNRTKAMTLGVSSRLRAMVDKDKYEFSRELKTIIEDIRTLYRREWRSNHLPTRQIAVALYFIDILALRAGHEKNLEWEADTVGCCNLKVENVTCHTNGVDKGKLSFRFLGKDSIEYQNTLVVDPKVFSLVQEFQKEADGTPKAGKDLLFETINAQDLNGKLQWIKRGLTAKHFRTCNASTTLDAALGGKALGDTVEERKAVYDSANKKALCELAPSLKTQALTSGIDYPIDASHDNDSEVAVLCNHQRAVPKNFDDQVVRMREKLAGYEAELLELQTELEAPACDEGETKTSEKTTACDEGDIKTSEKTPGKKARSKAVLETKVRSKGDKIRKLQRAIDQKQDLKNIALSTSKLNYCDPRITVAWCKRNEVPIESIYQKEQLKKFLWAMEVEPSFRF